MRNNYVASHRTPGTTAGNSWRSPTGTTSGPPPICTPWHKHNRLSRTSRPDDSMGRLFSSTTRTPRNDPVGLETSQRSADKSADDRVLHRPQHRFGLGWTPQSSCTNAAGYSGPLSSAICRACWRRFLKLGSAGPGESDKPSRNRRPGTRSWCGATRGRATDETSATELAGRRR